jgi:uncharacterized membrane protein YdbT with pleckstrin-like domain
MIDLRHLPNPVPDEKLVFLLRRHAITILVLVIVTLILLVAPFGMNWYLQTYRTDILENPNILTPLVVVGSIFFLFAWLFLFQYFMDYYLDTWIVTTKRIIGIEQSGLFHHTISESRLYRIQDVTASTNGLWATIFNYGNVEIQTAGEKGRFLFEQVSHPTHVSKTILELTEIDRRDQLDVAVEEFGMAEKIKQAKGRL